MLYIQDYSVGRHQAEQPHATNARGALHCSISICATVFLKNGLGGAVKGNIRADLIEHAVKV